MKSKMQSAADAASVGAISQSSPGYAAAEAMSSNGSVAAGVTDATISSMSNMCGADTAAGCTNGDRLLKSGRYIHVTKTGSTLTSVVTFHRPGAGGFLKVVGWQTLTISTHLVIERRDVHLSRFLSDAGCFGIDGVAVDRWRNDEEGRLARSTRIILCSIQPAVPWPVILRRKTAPASMIQCALPRPITLPILRPRPPPIPSDTTRTDYCMGYIYSRLGQTALTDQLINQCYRLSVRKQVPGLPDAMLSNLNNSLSGSNSLITGNSSSLSYSLTAATSCPTDGTDACIQLRLDAVGYAVTQLLSLANNTEQSTNVPNQFRIGLYPFIEQLYSYFPLTTSINGSDHEFIDDQLRGRKPRHAARYQYELKSRLRRHAYRRRAQFAEFDHQSTSAMAAPRPTRSPSFSLSPTAHKIRKPKAFPMGAGREPTTPPCSTTPPRSAIPTPARRSRTAASLSACCTFPIRRSAR
jgi:hypothetical protein